MSGWTVQLQHLLSRLDTPALKDSHVKTRKETVTNACKIIRIMPHRTYLCSIGHNTLRCCLLCYHCTNSTDLAVKCFCYYFICPLNHFKHETAVSLLFWSLWLCCLVLLNCRTTNNYFFFNLFPELRADGVWKLHSQFWDRQAPDWAEYVGHVR